MPVFTQSGTKLGQIADIEIDLGAQSIIHYAVKRGIVSHNLLLVHREQVISITDKEMIVDDAAAKESKSMKINEAMAQPVI